METMYGANAIKLLKNNNNIDMKRISIVKTAHFFAQNDAWNRCYRYMCLQELPTIYKNTQTLTQIMYKNVFVFIKFHHQHTPPLTYCECIYLYIYGAQDVCSLI